MNILNYFRNLAIPKIILWCYLIWYLIIIAIYFDSSIKLWASALGISCVIGFALILSTTQNNTKQNTWSKIRLFLFPFCVSSYSATIKDYDFILIFPTKLNHLLIASLACLVFFIGVWSLKLLQAHQNKLL